ncbi:hypothetical protein ABZ553_30460 [Streptomyces sparsogenes]|uniref:hypothetical protein n=1 Tax=Streptomyces sparsogenes TaxID=67365 RepID=UPI0033BFFFD3
MNGEAMHGTEADLAESRTLRITPRQERVERQERQERQERTGARLDLPADNPLGTVGEAGGARAAREACAHLHPATHPHPGAHPHPATPRGPATHPHPAHPACPPAEAPAAGPLPEGPVPHDELARLRRVHRRGPGYAAMREHLRRSHLLALCGEPGSGRGWTGLALLAELTEITGGGVWRLGPVGALPASAPASGPGSGAQHLAPVGEKTERGHGYLLELPADPASSRPAAPGPEALLDRLRAHFAEHEAFCVLLVPAGEAADRLLRGRRHAVPYEPPAAADVLDAHLADLLAHERPELLRRARATAARPEVAEALGLEEPLPGEAARLAGHLAEHARGELPETELLARCRSFAPRQARAWFADAGCPGTLPAALPAALPALRRAALRIALAVFNGSAHSLTAEAAELLAWELAVTLDPQYAPGRPLFAAPADALPAAARAVLGEGVEDLGEAAVPVRTVRFRGRRLAPAVLFEVWDHHHNARGPMARWLRGLCDDPRPQVWVRAAVAAGVLSARDYLYGLTELLLPLARGDSPVQRMAAATALAEASRDAGVRPAVAGLLSGWVARGDERERETAALAHGYGLVAGSVAASLEELGRIAAADGCGTASYSAVRLLAGPEPETVLEPLTHWLRDPRRSRRDLALLTALRAVRTRASHLWGLREVPEPSPYAAWPLATALAAARPGCRASLAELLRAALTWPRSAEAAEEALVGWMRRAAGDERQLAVLCEVLPLVAQDGDEPLDARAAARIREVLEAL